jgi:hypothetical protein
MPSTLPASTPATGSISEVSWSFNSPPTIVTFRAVTNVIGKLTVTILSSAPDAAPVVVTEGTSAEGPRNVALTMPAGSAGRTFRYTISLAPDVTTLRSYPVDGAFRVPGARTVANGQAVPVRWNTFGDGTRPANGGGTTTLGQGPAAGNWSSYAWAQYNPKMTTFPTP